MIRICLSRQVVLAAMLGSGWVTPAVLHGQGIKSELPPETNIKRASGQTIQPVFEGWQEYPDGRIGIWFGYLNRNFEEQIDLPVGPLNTVDFTPGGDSGQPTHFYPRRQKFLFKVDVPANFDKTKKVIWSVTAAGQKLTATGWLQPEWQIDDGTRMENNGGTPDPDNRAPEITGIGPQTVAFGKILTLTAGATDDGLPKPPPDLPRAKAGAAPSNAPVRARRAKGVTINWIAVRNPPGGGTASFDPEDSGSPEYGKPVQSTTQVTFSAPGNYWLRAVASDSSLEAVHDVKVTVTAK